MKRIISYFILAATSLAMGSSSNIESSELPPVLTPLMECSLANDGPSMRFGLFTAFNPHSFDAKGPGVILVDERDLSTGTSSQVLYTDVDVKTALLDCGGAGLGASAHYRLSGTEGTLRATFCLNPEKLPEGSWEVVGGTPLRLRCQLSK